jgi:LemA protein
MTLLVIVILLVVLILLGIGIYNRLVTARNGLNNAFAQIDVQLTRR